MSELFASLKQENWNIALEKINRIREIFPNDSAFAGIEVAIKNNLAIQMAQNKLDSGDIDEAIKVISDFTEQNGQTMDFRNAIRALNSLKDVKNMFVAKEKNKIELTFSKENLLGIEDLRADIDTEWLKHIENIDTLVAMIEAITPEDELPAAYRNGFAENWNTLNFTENYLNSNMEYIFFRLALTSPSERQRKNIMSILLSIEPNNYRSLALKGYMLNVLGEIDNSASILSGVKKDLSISNSQYDNWFILTPQNIVLYEINPFVLYPFFVYIPDRVKIMRKK